MPEENLEQLIQGGAVGIAILLIFLVAFILNRVFKMFANHINHETEAWIKNTEALTKLSAKIDQDIEAQSKTTEVLHDIKEVINRR